MTDINYEQFEHRIARLERQLKTSKALAVAAVVAAAAIGGIAPFAGSSASAQTNPRTVTRFQAPVLIMNASGETVAEISDQQGRYGLTVYGRKGGQVFLGTSAATDGGLVQLSQPAGKLTTQLGPGGVQLREGGSFLAYNPQGSVVAAFGAKTEGDGYMTLGGTTGNTMVDAGISDTSRGFVRVYPSGGPQPTVVPQMIAGARPR